MWSPSSLCSHSALRLLAILYLTLIIVHTHLQTVQASTTCCDIELERPPLDAEDQMLDRYHTHLSGLIFLRRILEQDIEVPEQFDWRFAQKSRISPPRASDQSSTDWSQTVTGLLEGFQHHLGVKPMDDGFPVMLSQQYLMDCSLHLPNYCDSTRYVHEVIQWLAGIGIKAHQDYLFDNSCAGVCRKTSGRYMMGAIKGAIVRPVSPNNKINEHKLKKILVAFGPIEVGVWVHTDKPRGKRELLVDMNELQTNSTLKNDDPKEENLERRSILVVGYGADAGGRKYWIIRNTAGLDWGYMGYGYLHRERHDWPSYRPFRHMTIPYY